MKKSLEYKAYRSGDVKGDCTVCLKLGRGKKAPLVPLQVSTGKRVSLSTRYKGLFTETLQIGKTLVSLPDHLVQKGYSFVKLESPKVEDTEDDVDEDKKPARKRPRRPVEFENSELGDEG